MAGTVEKVDRRRERVTILVTQKERDELQEEADFHGLGVSAYVRMAIAYAKQTRKAVANILHKSSDGGYSGVKGDDR